MKVAFFQRKPRSANFSIEELFATVREYLPANVKSTTVISPYRSSGIWPRIKICLYARSRQLQVNHITGDIHFTALVLNPQTTLLTVHDCAKVINRKGIKGWFLWFFWFYLPAKRVKLITVISEQTKKDLLSVVNFPPDRIRIIPNCVSPLFKAKEKPFNEDRPRILIIGTKKNKNLPRLIQALQGFPCELELIGPMDTTLKELLDESNSTYQNFSGLSHQDIYQSYVNADVISLISTSEGFGVPIIEGQAVGRVVITSDVEPMRSVAGGGAFLVDPYDIESIRNGFDTLRQNRELRMDLRARGFRNVEKYSPAHIADLYYQLYQEILKEA